LIDLVIVAEKSKYSRNELIHYFLNQLVDTLYKTPFIRVGFIVYCKYAVPLIDLSTEYRNLGKIYAHIPILRGVPEPAKAIYEAVEMLLDLEDQVTLKKKIVLVASFIKEPSISLEDALEYASMNDTRVLIIRAPQKKTHWILAEYEKAPEGIYLRKNNIPDIINELLK